MILVAGGTGTLGKLLVPALAKHETVRVLTRSAGSVAETAGIETFAGDLRNLASIERALEGVSTVVSAVSGFGGKGRDDSKAIDADANIALSRAAARSGVEHFVLVSILGVTADHPMELFRLKWRAEEAVRDSGLDWSIIRPAAYMETWLGILAAPLLGGGKALIFGRGVNPINFVSAHDVARAIELAVRQRRNGTLTEVGGPDDVSMKDVVETFMSVTGASGKVNRIPRPMLRVMSVAARPFNPLLARQAAAGVVMDTHDMTFSGSATQPRDPGMPSTSLTEAIKRDYAAV
jgi:NADH dehydrogenase